MGAASSAGSEDLTAANKRRAAVLVGGFAACLGVVLCLASLVLVPPLVGLPMAIVVATVLAALAFARADQLALAMLQAAPADPMEHARLHNLVESLCFTSGLPKPRVCVVDDTALNAFAAGLGPRRAAIGVTTGLLAAFTPVELEAVLAHELSKVKSDEALVATVAAVMVGVPTSILPRATSSRIVQAALGPRQDLVADLTGVALTRYPPGLISVLEKLRDGPTEVRSGSRATAHLWLQPSSPGAEAGQEEWVGAQLDARIEALREL